MGSRDGLPVPVTEAGQAGLSAILDDPAAALLAVDYDGVLAPIVPDPTNSPPLPGIISALARVAERLGAVAVITGRPAQVVVDYGQFDREPALADLVVFGHYGMQRWDARTGLTSPPPPAGLQAVRSELPGLLAAHALLGSSAKGRAVDAPWPDRSSAFAARKAD